ncbi:MAG: quinolinate synthase NadA, partial [Hyphomonadaceae bacterium]|nr:quinolinate synthase NadA [Clostridia bacterium]
NPLKKLYMLSSGLLCPNMKKTTLENVFEALQYNQYEMKLDNLTIEKARQALDKMLAV